MRRTEVSLMAAIVAGAVFGTDCSAEAEELRVAPDSRAGLAITVYGGRAAFVEEARRATLPAGDTTVIWVGTPESLAPDSLQLGAAPPVAVAALAVSNDVLTPDALLRRAVGGTVSVVRVHPTTGEETMEPAELLSVDGGLVLRYRGRIETTPPGRIVFDRLPGGLTPERSVTARVAATSAGERTLTLGYMMGGLSWHADYRAVVDETTASLMLTGRAIIDNATATDFSSASIALVAGDTRQVAPPPGAPMPKMRAMAADAAPPPERETLGDYHLYRLPGTANLTAGTTVLPLLSARIQGITVEYTSESWLATGSRGAKTVDRPAITYAFPVESKAGLTEPLPAGVVRFYTTDSGGALRFIGEDRMPPTPVGETIRLSPGRAFDVSVTRRQTDFDRLGGDNRMFETTREITVTNARSAPATVRIVEMIPGDWQILSESRPHATPGDGQAVWVVSVPASGREQITYRVRVTP